MLPIPSRDYFPTAFRDGDDLTRDAFHSKLDSINGDSSDEAKSLFHLNDPARVSAACLDALGEFLAAGLLPVDSEAMKREKIASAVETHKLRSLWVSLKAIVDATTGYSAVVFGGAASDWSVRVGDLVAYVAGFEWMLRGGSAGVGIIRTGSGAESIIPGNIYVDVGTSGLTAGQVAQIVASIISDVASVYYRIFLGYTTAGIFTVYSGGIVG
jgi:hypothetical protein